MRFPANTTRTTIVVLFLCCGRGDRLARIQESSFTIAAIPDTQNYVSFDHQKAAGYPFDAAGQFVEQMRYVAANLKSAGGNIAFVTSLGDNWNHPSVPMDDDHAARGFKTVPNKYIEDHFPPTEKARSYEMPLVRRTWEETVAGKTPFSVVPGNHDYDAYWNDSRFPPKAKVVTLEDAGQGHFGGLTNFNRVFGDDTPFFKDQPWYVASHDGGADSAQVFEGGGWTFLHIGLQYSPSDRSLAWAASVIKKYPGVPTIITTHDHLNPAGERLPYVTCNEELVDPEDDNAAASVWKKLLSKEDQIFLVLSGHQPGQSRRTDTNDFGHDVYQIMADYQDRYQSARDAGYTGAAPLVIGDGWMRLLTFDMSAATPTLTVTTYSTHYKKFSGEIPEYAAWYRPHEQPKMGDAEFLAAEDFVIPLADFRARFRRHGS